MFEVFKPVPAEPVRREIDLADEAATAALAARLATGVLPGDVIALHGDLGAGKTSFARAFIHACRRAAGLPADDVPSPTFTLVQVYEAAPAPIWHFDLYRLSAPEEIHELGLDEALGGGIVLVEWPDRLGPLLPAERLDLTLRPGAGDDARIAGLNGHGEAGRRLVRAAA